MSLILLVFACGPPHTVETHVAPDVASRIDSAAVPITDACADGAFAVLADGAVPYAVAWGATLDTPYEWASVSKPLTATLVMRLAESRRLSIDQPIVELDPTYAALIPADDRALTLANLLSHTGGITRVEHRHEPGMFMRPPGGKYRYSTNGYGIVGDVIAAVTNEPYARAVARFGEAYGMPSLDGTSTSWVTAGAMVRGSVRDLARFAAGLLDGTFVSETSRARMWTGVGNVGDDDVPRSPGSEAETYGLGFEIAGDGRTVAHTGRNDARRAFLYLRPEEKRGFVAVCTAKDAGRLLEWWPTAKGVLAGM